MQLVFYNVGIYKMKFVSNESVPRNVYHEYKLDI
jgi:hypothetical protein